MRMVLDHVRALRFLPRNEALIWVRKLSGSE